MVTTTAVDLGGTAARFLAQPPAEAAHGIQVDLRSLIDHRSMVRADDCLEEVHHRFAASDVGYMAVVDEGRVVGLCARHIIAMRLGSHYGFALFARKPVRDHLVADAMIVPADHDWPELLQQVFSRVGETFNDDVVLTDPAGGLLGLITVQSLMRLQTSLLLRAIDQLKQQRAETERRNRIMTAEIDLAREVQRAMQPRDLAGICAQLSTPQRTIRIVAHYEPAGLVSGDFFEVLSGAGPVLGILVADVMGHGVQAALGTAMLRALIQDHVGLLDDPAALLSAVNRSLCAITADMRDPVFVSAFAAALHVPSGTVTYANAGHPAPILLQKAVRQAGYLMASPVLDGGLLGIRSGETYHNSGLVMAPGDRLAVFTDGLFEVFNSSEDVLGQEGLLSLADAHLDKPGEELLTSLLDGVRGYSQTTRFADDVCLLIVGLEEGIAA